MKTHLKMEFAFVLSRKTHCSRDPHPAEPRFMSGDTARNQTGQSPRSHGRLRGSTFSSALIMGSVEILTGGLKLIKHSEAHPGKGSAAQGLGSERAAPTRGRNGRPEAAATRPLLQQTGSRTAEILPPKRVGLWSRRTCTEAERPPGDHGGSGRPLGTCEAGVLCHFVQNHAARRVKACKENRRGT